jgi:hypothetical protein
MKSKRKKIKLSDILITKERTKQKEESDDVTLFLTTNVQQFLNECTRGHGIHVALYGQFRVRVTFYVLEAIQVRVKVLLFLLFMNYYFNLEKN